MHAINLLFNLLYTNLQVGKLAEENSKKANASRAHQWKRQRSLTLSSSSINGNVLSLAPKGAMISPSYCFKSSESRPGTMRPFDAESMPKIPICAKRPSH